MKFRHFATPAVAAALAITITACGSEESPSSEPAATSASSDTTSAAASLNEADIEFAQGMIVHHEQAIEMAEIALDPNVGAGAEVVDLATRVRDAQDPEVQLMTAWLTAAGEPTAMDMSEGHDMSSMGGMMSDEQMQALSAATGPDFDRMWLEMMIQHHEGAISQSQTVKASGSNAEVLALADQIIAAQQAEIAEMQALLGS